jgi:hypothetical protein
VLPKAPKKPNTKSHMAVVKNINNVMENKPENPHKIGGCVFFYDYNIQVIIGMSFVLDKF